jgi:putative IMPACT (imprinted ancient) family translation regulator
MVKVEVVDKVSRFKCHYDRDFYPTKLLAFVEHIRIENTQETYAIVHSCIDSDSDSDYKRDSALTETRHAI